MKVHNGFPDHRNLEIDYLHLFTPLLHSLKTNIAPEKLVGWEATFHLGRPIFRAELLVLGRVQDFDNLQLTTNKNSWVVVSTHLKKNWSNWIISPGFGVKIKNI